MTVEHSSHGGRWAPARAPMQPRSAADALVGAPSEPEFLTVQEVADLLRISPGTVRAWIAKGEGPPAMRFGKQIRYRYGRVLEWVEEQEGDEH